MGEPPGVGTASHLSSVRATSSDGVTCPQPKFVCVACGPSSAFGSVSRLRMHEADVHALSRCSACGQVEVGRKRLWRHARREHVVCACGVVSADAAAHMQHAVGAADDGAAHAPEVLPRPRGVRHGLGSSGGRGMRGGGARARAWRGAAVARDAAAYAPMASTAGDVWLLSTGWPSAALVSIRAHVEMLRSPPPWHGSAPGTWVTVAIRRMAKSTRMGAAVANAQRELAARCGQELAVTGTVPHKYVVAVARGRAVRDGGVGLGWWGKLELSDVRLLAVPFEIARAPGAGGLVLLPRKMVDAVRRATSYGGELAVASRAGVACEAAHLAGEVWRADAFHLRAADARTLADVAAAGASIRA